MARPGHARAGRQGSDRLTAQGTAITARRRVCAAAPSGRFQSACLAAATAAFKRASPSIALRRR